MVCCLGCVDLWCSCSYNRLCQNRNVLLPVMFHTSQEVQNSREGPHRPLPLQHTSCVLLNRTLATAVVLCATVELTSFHE